MKSRTKYPGSRMKNSQPLPRIVPALPDIRAPRADRFAQAVRTLVEKRAVDHWPNENSEDLAVFVLVDYPRRFGEQYGGVPFADPIAQGTPLLGSLFFSNADASHGQLVSLPSGANAMLDWLEDEGLGDCAIVMVYRNAKQMVTRRSGVNNPARREEIRDTEPTATLPELMDALTHYHEHYVLTPTGCPIGVWEPDRARQYVPGPRPENSIQSDLERALNFWFRGVIKARTEDKTNIGRIDVRLLKKGSDGRLAYWIIIELKVIKSFTNAKKGSTPSLVNDNTNVEAIVKGVKQAGSYRTTTLAEEGLLEIFDLRKDKTERLTERPQVSAALQLYTPPPQIDVWPAFGQAEDARNAGYTGG